MKCFNAFLSFRLALADSAHVVRVRVQCCSPSCETGYVWRRDDYNRVKWGCKRLTQSEMYFFVNCRSRLRLDLQTYAACTDFLIVILILEMFSVSYVYGDRFMKIVCGICSILSHFRNFYNNTL